MAADETNQLAMVFTVQCSLFSVFEETGLALVEYKICFPEKTVAKVLR